MTFIELLIQLLSKPKSEPVKMITKQQLEFTENNEGYREFAYQCTAGKNTIGIGLNLDAGLPHDEALLLLNCRLEKLYVYLSVNYKWFVNLDEQRKIAIADMCYQLGVNGFSKFKKSIAFMAIGDYENAATEFLDSKWAKQTPKRAKKVTNLIRG
jgi:lysozyme